MRLFVHFCFTLFRVFAFRSALFPNFCLFPFAFLLFTFYFSMPRVRVHQHVNPLAPFYRQAPKPIDIESVFAEPDRPLLLDIGSARGRFLLRMAEAQPGWNYLGVEIRRPLVEEANRIASSEGLTNLYYAFCNAMLWLDRL